MVNMTDNPWPYPAPVEPVKKPRPRWVLPLAFVATFLVGLMFGSLSNSGGRADEPVAQSSPTTTEVAPSTGYTPPAYVPPPAEDDGIATMGVDQFTYADGLAIEVSQAKVFEPNRYAAGHVNPVAVRFEVKITNNGTKVFDPTVFIVNATYGGQTASQIFDGQELRGSPDAKVLPGKSLTFPVGFSIADGPGELQVDVQPSFRHNSEVFVGSIG